MYVFLNIFIIILFFIHYLYCTAHWSGFRSMRYINIDIIINYYYLIFVLSVVFMLLVMVVVMIPATLLVRLLPALMMRLIVLRRLLHAPMTLLRPVLAPLAVLGAATFMLIAAMMMVRFLLRFLATLVLVVKGRVFFCKDANNISRKQIWKGLCIHSLL